MSEPRKRVFSAAALQEVQSVLASYPVRDSAILPVLHMAQREFGCLDQDVVQLVAETVGTSPVRVAETMSFYTMFSAVPQGKHVIRVCTNVSCSLLGSRNIVEHLEKRLGIRSGSTRSDGLVTLETVECLGSCGTAPVMTVNDRYYENLTVEKIESILGELGI
jgi:NADH-quinone oxidoreductase subunit E